MLCKSYNTFFQNFANRTNLEIIFLLQNGQMNVSSIVEKTGFEQSSVSHNLKKLTECNILIVESKGRERFYSLNKDTVQPLLKLVHKHVEKNCKGCEK